MAMFRQLKTKIISLCMATLVVPVSANAAGSGDVTFIHMGDLHGHLIPRPNMREGDPDQGQMMGGLAYVYDQVKKIRKDHPNALLINGGDTVQGSAEALYTRGQAMVDILNLFKIDAFNPGNWDYLYGTERFRELFAGDKPLANWNALSANLYYSTLYGFPETRYAKQAGQRVLKPYMIKDVNGVRVGIIGLTADRGPQAVSTRVMDGFTMTPGEFEVAAAVPLLRNKHKVDLIVLISERGLGANLEIAETIPGIDIVLSSDMHEESRKELVAKSGTVLVEEGQDGTVLGELTAHVSNGKMVGYSWIQHRITTKNNQPDPVIAAKIEEIRKPFVKAGFVTHVNPINAAILRTPIDSVIGFTKIALHRSNFAGSKNMNAVIEGSSHDFIADAFRMACHADLGLMRGFRYGTHIAPGPIKLEDIYHYIPIGPQVACGKLSGDDIRWMLERGADSSLSPYVGWWGGGWQIAFSGLSYELDPKKSYGNRVGNIRLDGSGLIDMEKLYTVGGYWYVDNPNMINRHKAWDINVLKDKDGGILDATDVVAYYLYMLPDHTVNPELNRVRLLSPLPNAISASKEIQPLKGVAQPNY
jgi:2',3'-cyclic-nucleotide 2'-phosphodiesterase (5'-nucleotidase family)